MIEHMFDDVGLVGTWVDDRIRPDSDEPAPSRAEIEAAVRDHEAVLASVAAELEGHLDNPVVSGVAHVGGGPELAAWLGTVDPAELGEYDLVEMVAGLERVAAWAKARAAGAAAELSRRPMMNPVWPAKAGRVTSPCLASSELSLRLGVSRQAAARLVSTGLMLDGPLLGTGEALETGAIDWGKATMIADSLAAVPWEVAVEVEDHVLPGAPGRTHSQLRRDLERALAEVDPDDAQQRHRRAVAGRRVERPRVLPDGMASVLAVLPAEAAVRLDATLQGAAVAARAGGDSRTVDQLRADALDLMAGEAWASGWIGARPGQEPGAPQTADRVQASASAPTEASASPDPPTSSDGPTSSETQTSSDAPASSTAPDPPMRVGRVGGRRAHVMVTVGLGTLLGLDERPAELEGYGPVGADVARRIAVEGTWRRLLVDPVGGAVVDVGRTRYRPPPDLVELVRARNPRCVVPTCSRPASQCELDHTIPFNSSPTLGAEANVGADIPEDRSGLELGGSAGVPALGGAAAGEVLDLAGETSDPAGAVADASAAVPDPAGEVLDLAGKIVAAGCGDACGCTADHNVGPLCKTDHLNKTHGGFRLTQPEPGTFRLVTPTGHVYLELPARQPGVPWAQGEGASEDARDQRSPGREPDGGAVPF